VLSGERSSRTVLLNNIKGDARLFDVAKCLYVGCGSDGDAKKKEGREVLEESERASEASYNEERSDER